MASTKFASKLNLSSDLNKMRSPIPHKVPPLENSVNLRKPKKLQMTDSLVAAVEKIDVPNHTLNTKIYTKLQRNSLLECAPIEVHFAGFEVPESITNKNDIKKYHQKVRIINVSGQVQRMTVLPPQTKYFDIHYVKPDRLVPGFALEIQVIFKPDEYKYYNDAIRILSESDENLIVPLHAYPIISTYDFPTKYNFPNIAVGKSITRSFNMRSTAPIEFEYMIEIIQKHPSFKIEPLEGIIPFNRDAIISVTFSPIEFCTAVMTVQLIVSQFNSKPIVCTFFGSSQPGLAKEKAYNETIKLIDYAQDHNEQQNFEFENEMEAYSEMLDPRVLSPLYISRSKRKEKNNVDDGKQVGISLHFQDDSKDIAPPKQDLVEYEGYRFPKNLNNPWAISRVLMQKRGKLSMKELRNSSKSSNKVSAQVKEALFIQKVTELQDEERRNQLKWQVKLGESLVSEETKQDILKSRAMAEYEYKLAFGIPFLDSEIQRVKTINVETRTVRLFNKLARTDVTFDSFKNQIWELRYFTLDKFIQASRKVIYKKRLEKVLFALKRFISSWNEAVAENSYENSQQIKISIENYIEIYTKKLNGQNLDQNEELKVINSKTIGTYYFPQITEFKELQNQKDRHCEKLTSISKLESLGCVAVKPIEFHIQAQIPYINLAVPVLYKLNEYKSLTENNYVSKHENRLFALRKGAEDELIQIDSSLIRNNQNESKSNETNTDETNNFLKKSTDNSSSFANSKSETKLKSKSSLNAAETQIIDLVPMKELCEPIEYSPMHIFNPAPGLISYQKLLPYSGIDLNHHLNPLPRFEREQAYSTQKRFLDREDVIKGIMSWKKFPSQGLISLSNTPTITDVWVPRWSKDTFGSEIMPIETPQLLAGLPADDKENLLDESDLDNQSSSNSKVYLTPEMVNVQFNVPDIFELKEKSIKEEALRQLNRPVLYRNIPEAQFPHGDKLPATNLPVSTFGQVPRDQRQQELEYYLNKQYNLIGLRLQTKLNTIEKQFSTTNTSNSTSVVQSTQSSTMSANSTNQNNQINSQEN